MDAPDAESTSCHSSWSLEGQSWFEGVAAWQMQDQSYGGGAQEKALGHLTPLVSASPLVPDKARVASLSGGEVRVPVSPSAWSDTR